MSFYSIKDYANRLDQEERYYKIDNLNVDFRKLSLINNADVTNVLSVEPERFFYRYISSFESKLLSYCKYLKEHQIPFDYMVANANPSLIIKGNIYHHILESYALDNLDSFEKEGKIANLTWENEDPLKYIKMITIDDTIRAFPVDFTFTPYFYDQSKNKIAPSFEFLGLDDKELKENVKFNYKELVNFDLFITEILHGEYDLKFNDQSISSYEDYFNKLMSVNSLTEITPKTLSIKMDLRNNNIGR